MIAPKSASHRLPRFNMPFELGLFLGARRYGGPSQRRKCCLILDRDSYRFQIFCSDIAGQDIRAHDPPAILRDRYIGFRRQLPLMCRTARLRPSELTFLDYRQLVIAWLAVN